MQAWQFNAMTLYKPFPIVTWDITGSNSYYAAETMQRKICTHVDGSVVLSLRTSFGLERTYLKSFIFHVLRYVRESRTRIRPHVTSTTYLSSLYSVLKIKIGRVCRL
jgi:hypothetical protein